jgi:hypothetical protein
MAVMVMVMVMAATTACGFCLESSSSILSYYGPFALLIMIEPSDRGNKRKRNKTTLETCPIMALGSKHFENRKLKPPNNSFLFKLSTHAGRGSSKLPCSLLSLDDDDDGCKQRHVVLFIPHTGLIPVRNKWIEQGRATHLRMKVTQTINT